MDDGRGRLVVTRESAALAYAGRAFNVLVDGQQIGKIRNGATEAYDLAAGPHTVMVKVDLAKVSVPITVESGGTVELACGVPGGLRMFSPTGSVFLRPAPPTGAAGATGW